MPENESWKELIDHAKNFHSNIDMLALYDEELYQKLQRLCKTIEIDMERYPSDKQSILRMIFSYLYNFLIWANPDYNIFSKDTDIYADIFDACFFTTLCMFLHDTTRITGTTTKKYVYEHSLSKYNDKSSPNYFNISRKEKDAPPNDFFKSEMDTFRQFQSRHFKKQPAHIKRNQGSAVPIDSQHEWSLYFKMEKADDTIRGTFKSMRNLYNGINKALSSPVDNEYTNRLDEAFNEFKSDIGKISYEDYLHLNKYILDHLSQDKKYYGINLYRFEKEMSLYRTTKEIHCILNSNTQEDKILLFVKATLLKDLPYSKIYELFFNFKDIDQLQDYTILFNYFIKELTILSKIVFDTFIENGSLGNNWENIFLETTNNLAEQVFYDPSKIDYDSPMGAQKIFELIRIFPVMCLLEDAKKKYNDDSK